MTQEEDARDYMVLVNAELQYSLWLKELTIPPGWQPAGMEGKKDRCLQFVEEVWKDMRPLSLRKAMERDARS